MFKVLSFKKVESSLLTPPEEIRKPVAFFQQPQVLASSCLGLDLEGWGINKRREIQGSWVTGAPGFVPMPQQMYLQKQVY